MSHRVALGTALLAGVAFPGAPAGAQSTRDLIGYTRLQAELTSGSPTGAGVPVAQVEASDGTGNFPVTQSDPTAGPFAGKHFTLVPSSSSPAISLSGHAQTVGGNYYGNDASAAPGVHDVYAYSVAGWYQSVLHHTVGQMPGTTPARVANHSYLDSSEVIPRFDWLTDTDDLIQVVAVNNNDAGTPNGSSGGLVAAMNGIPVGRTDGKNVIGTDAVAGIYTAGRTAPLLVAPADATSYAAPVVAGVAATLVGVGHSRPELSRGGYISPRTGTKIYDAETSEVIKAALMAGADRTSISGYTANTANGLSNVYGAGRINVYNSYKILSSGEQEPAERGSSRSITRSGFDYEPSMTEQGSGTYYFTGDLARRGLLATLVVNAQIANPSAGDITSAGATLRKFDLALYDLAAPTVSIANIHSAVDNTQTLAFSNLQRRHHYMLKVTPVGGQGSFTDDYGLAWRFTPDPAITIDTTNGISDLFYGDLNGDRVVDTFDFSMFSANFGRPDGTWSDGDVNGDGVVNTLDFCLIAGNFGQKFPILSPGTAAPTDAAAISGGAPAGIGGLVPEPTTATMLLLASLAALPRRRRHKRR